MLRPISLQSVTTNHIPAHACPDCRSPMKFDWLLVTGLAFWFFYRCGECKTEGSVIVARENLAETVGFEPTDPVTDRLFSRQVH